MRAQIVLAALVIVAFGGLAGCVGANKDTPPATPPTGEPITQTGTGATPPIKVLAALTSTLTLDAPAWVVSGTEVPASLTAPANAKGALTYTWAIGPLPGTVAVTAAKADTGSAKPAEYIAAGASKSITFSTAGVYYMHCHPHSWMRSNVTVLDGASTKAVEVQIVDGAAPGDYRYVPENIVVGTGTIVTYKNVGAQPHTATALGTQDPALKKLPLSADKGTIKIEGAGWQRVVAIVQDSEGRIGFASKNVYTTATLPTFAKMDLPFDFTLGAAPLAGTPASAVSEPKSAPVSLEQAAMVFINYTFKDAAGGAGAPQNLAQVEIHFTKDGETQDALTSEASADGALAGKVPAGAYTLKVIPLQGAQLTGTVTIEAIYDLTPPAPSAPVAHDDSGGGHHH